MTPVRTLLRPAGTRGFRVGAGVEPEEEVGDPAGDDRSVPRGTPRPGGEYPLDRMFASRGGQG